MWDFVCGCMHKPCLDGSLLKKILYKVRAVVFSSYILENRKSGHCVVQNLATFSYTPSLKAKSKLLHEDL